MSSKLSDTEIPKPTKSELELYDQILVALFSHQGWQNVVNVDEIATEALLRRRARFGAR